MHANIRELQSTYQIREYSRAFAVSNILFVYRGNRQLIHLRNQREQELFCRN